MLLTIPNDMSFCFPVLTVILTVARIALVKPEKARGVEDMILRAAQMGQIVEKVPLCLLHPQCWMDAQIINQNIVYLNEIRIMLC